MIAIIDNVCWILLKFDKCGNSSRNSTFSRFVEKLETSENFIHVLFGVQQKLHALAFGIRQLCDSRNTLLAFIICCRWSALATAVSDLRHFRRMLFLLLILANVAIAAFARRESGLNRMSFLEIDSV